jgi:hypothetical protein
MGNEVTFGRGSRVTEGDNGTAGEGLAGTVVIDAGTPGDTGLVHPVARIIPANKRIRRRVLFFTITGYPAVTHILSGRRRSTIIDTHVKTGNPRQKTRSIRRNKNCW